tara:strand:+ start:442 stop:555 length:114 start_codon:yes stop_codon:yes gene_type:complete
MTDEQAAAMLSKLDKINAGVGIVAVILSFILVTLVGS